MKAVILAGGLGTRMREETEFKPKPMVEVGGKPILWHIMKILSSQGVRDFVICTGYKGDVIRDYFLNYSSRNSDFTIRLGRDEKLEIHGNHSEEEWSVTVAETGPVTQTGGRIFAVKDYVGAERFLITYGDGIADVNLEALIDTHDRLSPILTITTATPRSRFGVIEASGDGRVTRFLEKPIGAEDVNIGYMIAEPKLFDFLSENSILEEGPIRKIVELGQLGSYHHDGFWQPMDTVREAQILNEHWSTGQAPWKIWND
jgi:glucose-1-phosphate cytidylyltransferase